MSPIEVEFELGTTPEHAFAVWTERCSLWWPRSHCMTSGEHFEVVFEPRVGGRVYEVGDDGTQHDWGEVTVWEPPRRIAYRWHIFLPPEQATMVEVTFTPTDTGTRVVLLNSGFEVFGAAAEERVGRVGAAWESITDEFKAAL